MDREKKIIRTSIIGIIANVFLAGFKAVIGFLSNSIAIVLDAVNNLSDVLSSLITIIGTKLAQKKPDKKHPLGHGRIEYLTAMIISVIILYAGVTSFIESVKKIIEPHRREYSTISIVIISVAVVVKILLGRYVKSVGLKVNSDSLTASGTDALNDAIISATTLVAAAIFMIWGISLEAYLGVIISVVILKSGYEMLSETLSRILGERIDSELSKEIKKTLCEHPKVQGAYDLILHNYGPNTLVGSVHVEIPDTMTADEIDKMDRELQQEVYVKHQVVLAGIGIYSVNTKGDTAEILRERIRDMVMAHPYILQMHGFYMDEAKKDIRFDVVLDFAASDRTGEYNDLIGKLTQAFPEYHFQVTLDSDISD